jgi:hypothetical protein
LARLHMKERPRRAKNRASDALAKPMREGRTVGGSADVKWDKDKRRLHEGRSVFAATELLVPGVCSLPGPERRC